MKVYSRSIEDVVMVLNKNLHIIKVNAAFSKLFGDSGADRKMVNFADLYNPHDLSNELYDKVREVVNTKESFLNYVLDVQTNSGKKRIFDISCRILEHFGAPETMCYW